jgi:hypothetical protein
MKLDARDGIRCDRRVSEIYRDPLGGLRGQIATKRVALEERRRLVTPLLRALVPDALRDAMADGVPEADEADMAALSAADGKLDALLAAHEEAIGLAPKLRACPDGVPDPAYPGLPPPWVFEEAWHLDVRRVLEPRVTLVDPDAYIVRWGDRAYLARMRRAYEPVVYLAEFDFETDSLQGSTFHQTWLRTSVPERVPPLEVRPERAYHALGRALHLARELTVGDAAFDDRYWITGSAVSTELLVPAVRASLLALHSLGAVLTIGGGLVELGWSGDLRSASRELLPSEAMDVVLGIRAAVAHA